MAARAIAGIRIAAISLVAAAAVVVSAAPAVASASPRTGHDGAPYAVGKRSYTFVDSSRPTAPNGTYPGAPTRTVPTLLLYPAKGDPSGPAVENAAPIRMRKTHRFPLIVFSHGFGADGGPEYEELLLKWLVRRGYVVGAPTFPLTSGGAPGGPVLDDYVDQPGDVSFVLTRLVRVARNDRSLRKTIDRHQIGAAGHSLGASTTLGVATNSCCRDRRIDAAVSMSGIERPFPDGDFFATATPPLMLVHGDADRTEPYAGSVTIYHQAPAPKVFLTLLGGEHIPFESPWLQPMVRSITDFLDGFLKHRRKALRRLTAHGNVPGVASVRKNLGG